MRQTLGGYVYASDLLDSAVRLVMAAGLQLTHLLRWEASDFSCVVENFRWEKDLRYRAREIYLECHHQLAEDGLVGFHLCLVREGFLCHGLKDLAPVPVYGLNWDRLDLVCVDGCD